MSPGTVVGEGNAETGFDCAAVGSAMYVSNDVKSTAGEQRGSMIGDLLGHLKDKPKRKTL